MAQELNNITTADGDRTRSYRAGKDGKSIEMSGDNAGLNADPLNRLFEGIHDVVGDSGFDYAIAGIGMLAGGKYMGEGAKFMKKGKNFLFGKGGQASDQPPSAANANPDKNNNVGPLSNNDSITHSSRNVAGQPTSSHPSNKSVSSFSKMVNGFSERFTKAGDAFKGGGSLKSKMALGASALILGETSSFASDVMQVMDPSSFFTGTDAGSGAYGGDELKQMQHSNMMMRNNNTSSIPMPTAEQLIPTTQPMANTQTAISNGSTQTVPMPTSSDLSGVKGTTTLDPITQKVIQEVVPSTQNTTTPQTVNNPISENIGVSNQERTSVTQPTSAFNLGGSDMPILGGVGSMTFGANPNAYSQGESSDNYNLERNQYVAAQTDKLRVATDEQNTTSYMQNEIQIEQADTQIAMEKEKQENM